VQVRSGRFDLVLGLLVLGAVSSAPAALPQDSTQPAVTRKIKAKIDPKYPGLAKDYQLTGKVKIELTVSPDGSVKKTRVVGGSPLLADAAVEAVKQWRYESGSKETVETVDFIFGNASR
jgi:TonB family protein